VSLRVDQVWAEGQSSVKGAARQDSDEDEFEWLGLSDDEVAVWTRMPKKAKRNVECMASDGETELPDVKKSTDMGCTRVFISEPLEQVTNLA
jgi:hypothetical protein